MKNHPLQADIRLIRQSQVQAPRQARFWLDGVEVQGPRRAPVLRALG